MTKKHAMNKEQTDLVLPRRKPEKQANNQATSFAAAAKMKKGGQVKKAGGGTVYEAEMRGMKPSTKKTTINYEKDMKGMKPKAKAKMAMGGVGKIRLNQSTPAGAPKGPKKERVMETGKGGMHAKMKKGGKK